MSVCNLVYAEINLHDLDDANMSSVNHHLQKFGRVKEVKKNK